MSEKSFCPKCGAALQEGAQFCPHCMTSFVEKTRLKKEKKAFSLKKAVLIPVLILLVLALGIVVFFITYKPPIITFPEFKLAAQQANERLGCSELWEPEELKDTVNLTANGERVTKYQTKINIDGVQGAFFLTDKKDEAYFVICDVKESELENANKLIVLATDCIMNSYSDMDEIVFDDSTYAFSTYGAPYEKQFTDSFGRTEQYQSEMKSSAVIISKEKHGIIKKNILWMYLLTERDYGGKKLYDVAINFEYK